MPLLFWKKIQGHNRIRTNDRGNCSPTLYHWAMRPLVLFDFSFFPTCAFSFFSTTGKKTPPVGLEPTTLRLKAARSTDWARKALTDFSLYPSLSLLSLFHFLFWDLYIFLCYLFSLKRGLWRESNPRHLHPKQVFYHLTTKPVCHIPHSFFLSFIP